MLTQLPSDVVVGHLVRYLCVRDMLAARRVARSLRRLLQSPSDIRRALRTASMVRRRRVDISSYGGYVRRVDDEGHEWVLTTAGGTRQQWVRTPSPQVRMTRDPLPAKKCAEYAAQEKGDLRTAVEFLVLAKDEAKVRAPPGPQYYSLCIDVRED